MRLVFRTYIDGKIATVEHVDVTEEEFVEQLPKVGEDHAKLCITEPRPVMIEIEFVDEADPEHRFLRIGTDPRGMVNPIKMDLQ